MKFGESLANLNFPDISIKEGYYGVWPDYSDRIMTCNLLIDGSYMDTVTVVESSEKTDSATKSWQKPYALVEQTFTKESFAIRLLNPYNEHVHVWGFLNGNWVKLDSKARGQYLQVEMTGDKEGFCIVEEKINILLIIVVSAIGAVLLILIAYFVKRASRHTGARL